MSQLTDAQANVRDLAQRSLALIEDSTLTPAEKKLRLDGQDGKSGMTADLKKWQDTVRDLEQMEEARKGIQGLLGQDDAPAGNLADTANAQAMKSLGAQFAESGGYKALRERGLKGSQWSTGDVELKTTLTEGTAGSPGGGYTPATINPTIIPGVLDLKFAPLVVSDLFAQGTTDSPLIRYMVETALTNAAATVAEGALKPESALSFSKVDEVLHKIATFLPVSDEMLEDYGQIVSYINGRLSLFVRIAETNQLLTGDGTGANLTGILNRTGLAFAIPKAGAAAGAQGTGSPLYPASDNDMDVIYRQITQIRTTAFMEPDAIVINPADWMTILLSKSAQGAYYANGPFASTTPAVLWGLPVVATPYMTKGTALVGAFKTAAQIFRKGGLTVEASNSHSDFFQRNLTAIRAEERLGLAVYRPGAFGTVTGL